MEELMDGDILVFQREEPDLHHYDLPTAKEYFRSVVRMLKVCIRLYLQCRKIHDPDHGFDPLLPLAH